ncbi:RBBP9/YdeN family alpha/beta hydrolase [Kocuria turfanensis]|uniref:RBBP9/YdeN family alpha/beta hydrolase n=1 Tax=Kocuria turfanensis TaxID=388357 RepID=UPI0007889416|nr:alpha/beta fold hydrolase [Kocuria turfanensis]
MTVPDPDVRTVVVVHGYDAAPDQHWFPWLRAALAADGVRTVLVELPEPSAPEPAAWQAAVARAVGEPDEHTHLVGHSLGCITILRHLAGLPQPWSLGGLVLVAGFTGPLESEPSLDAFLAEDVDVAAVRTHVRRRLVLRSDDDPTVPPAATDALAARLDAEVQVVGGAGHFRGRDGITRRRGGSAGEVRPLGVRR